jgi:hypothetical protein
MTAVVSAPLHMLEAVAAIRLPPVSDRRLGRLTDRNVNGELTPDARDELESRAELRETISLIRAQALAILG